MLNLFNTVVQISWQASIIVALILCAQWLLGNRLSPNWRCALWGLLLVRLALPTLPASQWSLFNFIDRTETSVPLAASSNKWTIRYGEVNASIPENRFPITPSSVMPIQTQITWSDVLAGVWLVGVIAILTRFAVFNWRFSRRLRQAGNATDETLLAMVDRCCRQSQTRRPRVVETELVDLPALYGVFHPTLLLSQGLLSQLSQHELRFVLLHELVHLKRRDVLINWIVWIFNAIHWFNPLLWLAANRFRADREMACDAKVLSIAHPEDRSEYGRTILKLLEIIANPQRVIGCVGILEGRAGLHRRISAIARPAARSYFGTFAAVIVIMLISLLTLTRAQPIVPANQPLFTTQPAGMVVRVYDIRDLIVSIDDWNAPPAFNEHGFPVQTPRPTTRQTDEAREKLTADLKRKLQFTVALESWTETGGGPGKIVEAQGQFLITQTPENHALIAATLDAWREERGVQVTVETRFITDSNLPETLLDGGQWINEKEARRWSAFLDDAQVSKLIKDANVSKNTTTLTAPRLTLFNHQRANITVVTETAYVASINTKTGVDGKTEYDPIIKTFPSGTVLDCRATVNDNRESVKLDLNTRLSRLDSLTAQPLGDSQTGPFIQIPHSRVANLATTIDIPGGKSVVYQIQQQRKPGPEAPPAETTLLIVKPSIIQQRQK